VVQMEAGSLRMAVAQAEDCTRAENTPQMHTWGWDTAKDFFTGAYTEPQGPAKRSSGSIVLW
jgi:hypothetical protein